MKMNHSVKMYENSIAFGKPTSTIDIGFGTAHKNEAASTSGRLQQASLSFLRTRKMLTLPRLLRISAHTYHGEPPLKRLRMEAAVSGRERLRGASFRCG